MCIDDTPILLLKVLLLEVIYFSSFSIISIQLFIVFVIIVDVFEFFCFSLKFPSILKLLSTFILSTSILLLSSRFLFKFLSFFFIIFSLKDFVFIIFSADIDCCSSESSKMGSLQSNNLFSFSTLFFCFSSFLFVIIFINFLIWFVINSKVSKSKLFSLQKL